MALKNFGLAECIYVYRAVPVEGDYGQHTYDSDPIEGSNWRNWWDGREPRVDKEYARAMWPWLSDAVNCFISPSASWDPPEKYSHNGDAVKRRAAIKNIRNDLNLHFLCFADILFSEGSDLLSPQVLQTSMASNLYLAESYPRTLAAYSIYCQDAAITGLLQGDPRLSAAGAAYAIAALDLAHRDRALSALGSSLEAASARSRLARYAQQKREEKAKENPPPYKTAILNFLFEEHDFYPSRKEFIEEMALKFSHVVSIRTIERYLEEVDFHPPHWRARKKSGTKS